MNALRSDGDIDVLDRCRKGSVDGEEKSALGRARVVDETSRLVRTLQPAGAAAAGGAPAPEGR